MRWKGGGGGVKREGCIILLLWAWVTNSRERYGAKPESLYTVILHIFIMSAQHTSPPLRMLSFLLGGEGGGWGWGWLCSIHVPEKRKPFNVHCWTVNEIIHTCHAVGM